MLVACHCHGLVLVILSLALKCCDWGRCHDPTNWVVREATLNPNVKEPYILTTRKHAKFKKNERK